jgi:hypothetical protein
MYSLLHFRVRPRPAARQSPPHSPCLCCAGSAGSAAPEARGETPQPPPLRCLQPRSQCPSQSSSAAQVRTMSWCITHSQASRPSRFRFPSAAPSSSTFDVEVERHTSRAIATGSAPATTRSRAISNVEAWTVSIREPTRVGQHGCIKTGCHLRRHLAALAAFTSRYTSSPTLAVPWSIQLICAYGRPLRW